MHEKVAQIKQQFGWLTKLNQKKQETDENLEDEPVTEYDIYIVIHSMDVGLMK